MRGRSVSNGDRRVVRPPVGQRAGEQHRRRVQQPVEERVGERARPVVAVRLPVPVLVAAEAAVDHTSVESEPGTQKLLSSSSSRPPGSWVPGTAQLNVRVELQAVLEVPDLVGHRHVVGVRRPRVATRVGRSSTPGGTRTAACLARRRVRRVQDVPEAVGDRRGHRAALAVVRSIEVDPEPGRRVVHVDEDPVARAHHQVLGRVGVDRAEVRRVEGAGEQRVGRRLRLPAPGDVGPVDRLGAAEHVVVAGGRVLDAGVLVERPAVDRHRRAVLVRGAAEALELRDVARAVELQLHVRVARMLADVVRPPSGLVPTRSLASESGVQTLVNSGADSRVAQREAEPERRAQLEVPRRAHPALRGERVRLGRQRHQVGDVVARARHVRLELDRGLVVSDVLALRVLVGIRAQRRPALAQRLLIAAEVGLAASGGGRRARGRGGPDGQRIRRHRQERRQREHGRTKSLHRSVPSVRSAKPPQREQPPPAGRDVPRHMGPVADRART